MENGYSSNNDKKSIHLKSLCHDVSIIDNKSNESDNSLDLINLETEC